MERSTIAVLVASEQFGPTLLQNHDPNVPPPRWLGINRAIRRLRSHREKVVNNHFLMNSIEVELTYVKSSRIVLLRDKKFIDSVRSLGQG